MSDKTIVMPSESIYKMIENIKKQQDKVTQKSIKTEEIQPYLSPEGEQLPLFNPTLYDIAIKDYFHIMDVAVFRLSKRYHQKKETIRYDLSDGYVEVSSGETGMASIWDYDILLMAISQVTESYNLYKKGRGKMPGKTMRLELKDIFKFCRRTPGGKQKDNLVSAVKRLNTTHVHIERNIGGKILDVGENLISRYAVISDDKGSVKGIEIEIPSLMYYKIVNTDTPAILTLHPDFHRINTAFGRFVYRLARRVAGKKSATYLFSTLYERSGSKSPIREFRRMLRKLIKKNVLPEYDLKEMESKHGEPLLVMTFRDFLLEDTDKIE
ncbi:MAG: hypothetical protein B6242_17495 [Anaerolineaceae bacterium 4572_78]|nr:MAG: hypothetical protein B6242_17495 [Anaerolineaceae bacterium 4572_78]